jgi:serine protease Do
MMTDEEMFDLLDQYAKGTLSPKASLEIKARMNTDSDFRRKAEEHLKVIQSVMLFGRREAVIKTLQEIKLETPIAGEDDYKGNGSRGWKKYWPTAAVAASVAMISILLTLLINQLMDKKQTATDYKELRRNVEEIKKSQNVIMADIAETKEQVVPKPNPGRYTGTGFLVSSNGYVITSYHVVKGADSVYIENGVFGNLKTTVVYSDASNDVSILRIENHDVKLPKLPYSITAGEAYLGEDVFTLGFPREEVVFGEGSISALTGYRQNPNAYQVSVPVNPGNSGGPLFNSKGDIVGIISGIQTETSGAAFAIKSSVILDVITNMPVDSLQNPITLPKYNVIKNMTKVDQVRKWKDNVFIVRVYNNK